MVPSTLGSNTVVSAIAVTMSTVIARRLLTREIVTWLVQEAQRSCVVAATG